MNKKICKNCGWFHQIKNFKGYMPYWTLDKRGKEKTLVKMGYGRCQLPKLRKDTLFPYSMETGLPFIEILSHDHFSVLLIHETFGCLNFKATLRNKKINNKIEEKLNAGSGNIK